MDTARPKFAEDPIREKPTSRTLTIPLEEATETYGTDVHRWVSPDNIVLRGSFRHNRHCTFKVNLFETSTEFLLWHGEADVPRSMKRYDVLGYLDAQATVIAAQYGPRDYKVGLDVREGDLLRTYLGTFEIRDDWPLHDPYLMRRDPR